MSVKKNLIDAKALINTPEKWWKGSLYWNGCYCALGAVGKAETGKPYGFSKGVVSALLSALPSGFHSIVEFNDDPNTTHADIMALFDRAIASCED